MWDVSPPPREISIRCQQSVNGAEGEFVSARAKAADDAARRRGDVGPVSKLLAGENIREMKFDDRFLENCQRVQQRHRGVRKGAGVDDDRIRRLAGLLDPGDQLAFRVRLAKIQGEAVLCGVFLACPLNICESIASVDFRFSNTQHVEIGAV